MPDVELARDSLERWNVLDRLISKLYAKVPASRRDTPLPLGDAFPGAEAGEMHTINEWLNSWKEALEFAPTMGGALRAAAMSDWVTRYNNARKMAIDAGVSGVPPQARDINRLATDVDENIVKPVKEIASGIGTGIMLLGVLYVLSQSSSAPKRVEYY